MSIYTEEAERKSKIPQCETEPLLCGVCGKGPKTCSFEKACSCWRGVPCKPRIVAECWTCATYSLPPNAQVGLQPLVLKSYDVEKHRAAGHDVRDVRERKGE